MRFILTTLMFLMVLRADAEITVGAAGQVTSFAAAQQTATATPNSVIRYIDDSVTGEELTVNAVNTSLTLEGDGHTWGAPSGAGYCLNVSSSMLGSVTVNNFVFNRAVTEGSALNRLVQVVHGATGYTKLSRCGFIVNTGITVNTGAVIFNTTALSTYLIDRCYGSVPSGAVLNFGATNAGVGSVRSGRFTAIGNAIRSVSLTPVTIAYCDLLNSTTGFLATTPNVVINTIFSGNTTDRNLSGTAATTDFTYCAYTNSNANPGTGSITITAAQAFCNQEKYWIRPGGPVWNSGVSIDGSTNVDIGLDGVRMGYQHLPMGCMGGSTELCGSLGLSR
jgi:hypothetical protein